MTTVGTQCIAVLDDVWEYSTQARAAIETMFRDRVTWSAFNEVVVVYDFEPPGGSRFPHPRDLITQLEGVFGVLTAEGRLAALERIHKKQVPTFIFCDAYMSDVIHPAKALREQLSVSLAKQVRRLVAAIHDRWGDDSCPFRVQFWSREWEELEADVPGGHQALLQDPDTHARHPWAHYCVKPRFDGPTAERKHGLAVVARHLRKDQRELVDLPQHVFAGDIGELLRLKLEEACKRGLVVIVCEDRTARRQAVTRALRFVPPGRHQVVLGSDDCSYFFEQIQQNPPSRTVFEAELPANPELQDREDIARAIETVRDQASEHAFILHLAKMGQWEHVLRDQLGLCVVEIPPLAERPDDVPDLVRRITGRSVGEEEKKILIAHAPVLTYARLFGLKSIFAVKGKFGQKEDWEKLKIDLDVSSVKLRLVEKAKGGKAAFDLKGELAAPVPIKADAQTKNFYGTMLLYLLATSPTSAETTRKIAFSDIKTKAEHLKQTYPALWEQDDVQNPLFDERGQLRHKEWPQDLSRITEAINEWLKKLGSQSSIQTVNKLRGEEEAVVVRTIGKLEVKLEGFEQAPAFNANKPGLRKRL